MRYSESLLDLIGNTPLVRLRHVVPDGPTVLAKVEYFNPGGSVKDRIAVRMIDAAEESGELKPGGTIVEPTSGNTGIGLAIVAQQRGYKCIFVCPDKVSGDKIDTLRAYGAEVVVCPTAVAPEDPRSYYSVSDRLTRETDGGWKPNQYANANNPRSHYETTGPELWEQTDGRITHFVAGVGTGGTISGTGRYLKERGPVRVIGADPEGSVYSGGTGRPYLVEGVGEDFWPSTYDPDVCDEIIAVSDADSFAMTRRLAREEGLLVGGSCGMAVVAAARVAAAASPDDVVVVLLPDGGRGYLSKIFNDAWLRDYGFVQSAGTETVGEVLRAKSGETPSLVHGHPNETVREAIDILREYGVSQMPIVRAEPPVTAGEVVGSVSERALLDALFGGTASLADAVEPHMSPPLPIIGSGESVSEAVAALGGADALLVHIDGKPAGVITRQDLLGHLAGGMNFDTAAIHAGQEPDPRTGSVAVPIYQTSTYKQDGVGGLREGYEYSRSANPTRTALETALAALEGGARGLAFASGLAAEDTLLRTVCRPGDHVLLPGDAYGGTYRLVARVLANWGVEFTPVPLGDLDAVRAAVRTNTKVVWCETPTNPLLGIADIAGLAAVAHDAGAILVVDNTFASPYLQQPIALGADVVVHSTTKYLGGHSDVVGGALVAASTELGEELAFHQNAMGAVAGPFDAWLVLRGIKTLGVRMDRHCANAVRVVEMLTEHPAVASVLYPGLPSHPGHDVAAQQMRDFGGMVSFRVRGGEEQALKVCGLVEVFTLGESLGGVESLIEHPGRMTHASVAGSPLEVPADLVRLSVGIEDADDLVADLAAALA